MANPRKLSTRPRCDHDRRIAQLDKILAVRDASRLAGELLLELIRRVQTLEAQVQSLQFKAPRGIPSAQPSCDPGEKK